MVKQYSSTVHKGNTHRQFYRGKQ